MGNYKLKEIRTDNDMTQRQIAKTLGVSRSTYSGWENENDNIPLIKLNNFCEFFNVSLDYAVGIKIRNNQKTFIKKSLNPKTIGTNLEIIRKENNLIQQEFAKQMGISPSTYVNYKKGNSYIQTEILKRIALKYNISMDWIIGKSNIKHLK